MKAVHFRFVGSLISLLLLSGCANSPLGQSLERTFAADPQLEASPPAAPIATPPTPSPSPTADLPADLPRYPNAELVGEPTTDADGITTTRWRTTDGGDRVRQFYQDVFQSENWQVQSNTDPLIAQKGDLRVRVAIAGNAPTEFTLTYQTVADTAASPTPNASPTRGTDESTQFGDVSQAPAELQSFINDLAALGVLDVGADASLFRPNQVITRREYARWLVATNNRLFQDQPAKQIRLASSSAQPAFQDVRSNDPDFGAIQGLAEAGLIPSPLSGDSTTVTFRPDAPLTRENLIAWKVPIDNRQSLPTASIDAVKQTWGFQDTSRIDPGALRAVLADFQNADQSNIRRAFGYTKLFQPKRTVSRAEAAAVLWFFGTQGEGVSARDSIAQPVVPSNNQ